jgi:hypothetical protein
MNKRPGKNASSISQVFAREKFEKYGTNKGGTSLYGYAAFAV